MTGLAFLLVIVAALVHATWNFLAKRVDASGPPLVWLFSTLTVLIYFPIILYFVLDQRPRLDGIALLFMLGTFVLHLAYFLLLQQGYPRRRSLRDLPARAPARGPRFRRLRRFSF